jgi:hypothetical protein
MVDDEPQRTLQNTMTFFKNFSAKMLREIVLKLVLQVGHVGPWVSMLFKMQLWQYKWPFMHCVGELTIWRQIPQVKLASCFCVSMSATLSSSGGASSTPSPISIYEMRVGAGLQQTEKEHFSSQPRSANRCCPSDHGRQ